MVSEEIFLTEGIGTVLGGLVAGLIIAVILVGIGLYIYFALALQSIGKKLKYKNPWFAWIPFLNIVMILELGKFHWAWIFLLLAGIIPIIGVFGGIALIVLCIISFWRIFENAGYAGALSLLLLVPIARMIIMGIVAWEKKEYPKKSKK